MGFVAVVYLLHIKSLLIDPHKVKENWDINYLDPYSWSMVSYRKLGMSKNYRGVDAPKIHVPYGKEAKKVFLNMVEKNLCTSLCVTKTIII